MRDVPILKEDFNPVLSGLKRGFSWLPGGSSPEVKSHSVFQFCLLRSFK
jgi:hypothetical protein